MKKVMDLDMPNIGRGFHISVRELDHRDTPLGHDKYSYKQPEDRQVLWTRFGHSWREKKDKGET